MCVQCIALVPSVNDVHLEKSEEQRIKVFLVLVAGRQARSPRLLAVTVDIVHCLSPFL